MPSYFDALNGDYRYQLTPLGAPAPDLHIKQELKSGRFVIGGARPGQSISWQVTGTRRDPFALWEDFPVEREKPEGEKGLYLHPEAYGLPETMGIVWNSSHHGPGTEAPRCASELNQAS
jgi:hypothetical protein